MALKPAGSDDPRIIIPGTRASFDDGASSGRGGRSSGDSSPPSRQPPDIVLRQRYQTKTMVGGTNRFYFIVGGSVIHAVYIFPGTLVGTMRANMGFVMGNSQAVDVDSALAREPMGLPANLYSPFYFSNVKASKPLLCVEISGASGGEVVTVGVRIWT